MTETVVWCIACVSSALSGACSAYMLAGAYVRRASRRTVLAHAASVPPSFSARYASGVDALLIRGAIRLSHQGGTSFERHPIARWGMSSLRSLSLHAGLSSQVNEEGLCRVRLEATAACGIVACLLGSLLSPELAVVGLLAGIVFGWRLLNRALRREGALRTRALERGLSQTLEVICLGLRSGMTFDRALQLYCTCFGGVFADELSLARVEWSSGMRTREEALRLLAESYDSALFARVVDSVVRSLRFGSPLADSLEQLAAEARRVRRCAIEEVVMKAPVKMMIPVGTLILPSMLLLVLGPILLDVI